jgi:hypothetical protein
MAGRTFTKEHTRHSKVYKRNHQDKIYYMEGNKWVHKNPTRNWKYWRRTKWILKTA